ncbi:MAG: cell division protein FtsZ [Holosporales bacterium]|jgi:cell division protein FtsZ|nr:cell division protein FtsZ [Holosporales bacterium]
MERRESEEEVVGSGGGFGPRIIVIGVGGAGGNAVNNMIRSNLEGVNFVVANTDAQALEQSMVPKDRRIQLGTTITQGLGAGSKPEIGCAAAEESAKDIIKFIGGANMVFITAGMGGGTGTGAAPVIAKAAKEAGILTVGVVTKPFMFEGSNRTKIAERGISELQQYVDTLLIIPNQNLFRLANETTTFADAFRMADNVLYSGVRGVTDLMIMPGLINLDFADIRAVMSEMGKAMMGTGEAEGERRAIDAAEAAISNPLLDDVSLHGASGVLISITGGFDMTLYEVDEAANRIREEVEVDANIIFGSTFDERLNGRIRVSVVATGIGAAADISSFKNMDLVNRQNIKNTNAAKMFEGINVSDTANVREQAIPADPKYQDTYQEIRLDTQYVNENQYSGNNVADTKQTKKSGSFFDMFKSKSQQNQYPPAPPPQQQKPQQQPIIQDAAAAQDSFVVNRNKKPNVQEPDYPPPQQQQQQAAVNSENDYDMPSCFRRKK